MIPYISKIDTNVDLVIFILGLLWIGCVFHWISVLDIFDKMPPLLVSLLTIVTGMLVAYITFWVVMGDSVWWSAPIGIWLRS